MKKIAVLLASAMIAAPAVSAPVFMTVKNENTVSTMKVSKVSACGILYPTPQDLGPKEVSDTFSTDCGGSASVISLVYTMGMKSCTFNVSTIYTPPNYLFNPPLPGYWTPSVKATSSGGATCRVVSQDPSLYFLNGGFGAVFSMK